MTFTAQQDSVCIAGFLATTEAVRGHRDAEPKGSGAPAVPGGGGMGDMY